MDIERLANKARRSISQFCIEECKSYCCRNGHLVLTMDEVELVVKKVRLTPEKMPVLKPLDNGKFSLYIGNHDDACPSLKDYKCIVHKNKKRPLVCQQFPLFIHDMVLLLSSRCSAVKAGLFYPFEKKFMALGYKIRHSESLDTSEFYNIKV